MQRVHNQGKLTFGVFPFAKNEVIDFGKILKEEQFKHDEEKPKVTNKTMQEQLWEQWLDKDSSGNMGDGGNPAQTSMTTGTTGVYNPVYGKDGRIKGQEEDKEEEKRKMGNC